MGRSITIPHLLRVFIAAALLSTILLVAFWIDDAQAATPTATPEPKVEAQAATKTATPKPPPPPEPIKASQVLANARQYVGVPYVFGGFSASGFDCSGYISKIWALSPRRTTETMGGVTRQIAKGELLPGDALNYPLAGKIGHIRLFDKWATADKALVWVYEATEPEVMHRVVPYDPRYIPVRRLNIVNDVAMPPPPPLPADWNKPPKPVATPAAAGPAATKTPTPVPPGTITGVVFDEKTGQPVPKARVFYWSEKGQYSVNSVVSNADGKYTIAKITAGMYELATYANGYDVEFRGGVDLRSGGTARLDLELVPSIGDVAGQRIGIAPPIGDSPEDRANRNVAPPTEDAPDTLPLDHDIPGGHFFTQTSGRDGISGFAVTNENGVKFWSEFQRLGGVQALGYPVSRRFQSKGFTVQVMQKGVLQWRPEVGQAWLTNVFDEMHEAGKDDWLLSKRSTPKPLDPKMDDGLAWVDVIANRLSFLSPQAPIDKRYDSVKDPMTFFGLPTSKIEDMGNHYAIRLQRAVIQLWKVDVPWAKAGETTVANGGDVAKEAGIFPDWVHAPQRSPRLNGG